MPVSTMTALARLNSHQPADLHDATGWQPSPDEPAGTVFGPCRPEIAAADAVLAGLDLDAARERIDGRTWLGPPDSRVPRD